MVAATLRLVGGPRVDVEDLVQNVFALAIRGQSSFRGHASPKTWLYRIAVNAALQELRRQRRSRWLVWVGASASEPELEDTRSGPNRVSHRRALADLDEALATLSDAKRAAFVLVDVEGLSLDEAASVLDVPLNTVRSRLGAARREILSRVDVEWRNP